MSVLTTFSMCVLMKTFDEFSNDIFSTSFPRMFFSTSSKTFFDEFSNDVFDEFSNEGFSTSFQTTFFRRVFKRGFFDEF
jgi:hypothetical protein